VVEVIIAGVSSHLDLFFPVLAVPVDPGVGVNRGVAGVPAIKAEVADGVTPGVLLGVAPGV